jgi:hypothetical protein
MQGQARQGLYDQGRQGIEGESMSFHVPEQFRIRKGKMQSDESFGNNGAFFVRAKNLGCDFVIIASDGEGWEHVSISLRRRAPYWHEMEFFKRMFWDAEDCVIQYHPPKSEYVNNHPFCLHLWRKIGQEFELPPSQLVGIKEKNNA